MDLNKDLLLKSLNICLHLPIMVFNQQNELVTEYRSKQEPIFYYNYGKIINEVIKDSRSFYYINGQFNEMFLLYIYENKRYLFGPFKCNLIDKKFFDIKMKSQNLSSYDQELLYTHLTKIPLFALGDTKNMLFLVHYFFTGRMEDLLHDNLYENISLISAEVELECVENILSQSYNPEEYLFLYENKFEEYVVTGDLKNLKDLFFNMGNGIIPTISGDTIRSEKNYSIIIFEKLTQVAINNGVDVAIAYRTRDNLIRKNELSVSLNEVQNIRDSCIIIFMEKINKVKLKKLSPLILSVIQYIGINIHKKITVRELAKYFSMSETMLRKTFKKEMHMTVYSYISRRKIDTAKVMLKTDYTISEVALALAFSDSAHFCKVFKKFTGSSPKKYKQLLKNRYLESKGI